MKENENFHVQGLLDAELKAPGLLPNSPAKVRVNAERPLAVFVGHDVREQAAVDVCLQSIAETTTVPTIAYPLVLDDLRQLGLYTRKVVKGPGGVRHDEIDGRPFSTDFAFSRFLTPFLGLCAGHHDMAIFMDCDMLVTRSFRQLLNLIDLEMAVSVVKHDHAVRDYSTKMDGQIQQAYPRKNWSSFMVFNLRHPATHVLTPKKVDTATGAELHRFEWVADELIGSLPPEWNHLVGYTTPAVIHYTEGGPWFPAYRDVPWAAEWLACRDRLRAELGEEVG